MDFPKSLMEHYNLLSQNIILILSWYIIFLLLNKCVSDILFELISKKVQA